MDQLKTIDFKYLFTSYEGRISRRPFWIAVAIMFALAIVLSIASSILAAIFAPLAYIVTLVSIASIYPACAVYAKRWHDRGKSGWWTLICLIPLVGPLYMIWELGIQPSVEAENNYGAKPVSVAA